MANGISYLPVWERYLQQFREAGLSHEEVGELFIAMMEYQFEDKQPQMKGAGKCIWPFIKPDLDQAKAKYNASVANGTKSRKKKSADPDEPGGDPGATQHLPSTPLAPTQHPPGTYPAEPMTMSMSKTKSKTSLPSGEGKESTHAPAKQAEKAYGEFGWVKLTDDEFNRLLNDLGEAEVKRCIAYVDESAQTTGNKNRWRDWNLVIRKCARDGWGLTKWEQKKKAVPMGASGKLGQAELDAIARVMRED